MIQFKHSQKVVIFISKKNIYKGAWWFNNKRKHPSIIIKSNNKDYFVVRTLSHSKERNSDLELYDSPNPNDIVMPQYISGRKYYEKSKEAFGKHYKNIRLSYRDTTRFKKWNKKR